MTSKYVAENGEHLPCRHCGAPVLKRKDEVISKWHRRGCCSVPCGRACLKEAQRKGGRNSKRPAFLELSPKQMQLEPWPAMPAFENFLTHDGGALPRIDIARNPSVGTSAALCVNHRFAGIGCFGRGA